jgi:hypothetical protein
VSYKAFGADAWCAGKNVGDVCDEHARCNTDLVCVCDEPYLTHPTTQKCVSESALCAEGTAWSAAKGQCVADAERGEIWETLAWVTGGAALGIGLVLLLTRRPSEP